MGAVSAVTEGIPLVWTPFRRGGGSDSAIVNGAGLEDYSRGERLTDVVAVQ